jgi:hypothetical protein
MKQRSFTFTFAFANFLIVAVLLMTFPLFAQESTAAGGKECGCMFVDVKGNTSVKLRGATKSVPAKPRMLVHFGDLLFVGASPGASLVCDGEKGILVLTKGPQAVPCDVGPGKPILIGGHTQNARLVDDTTLSGGSQSDIPIVLAPRATRLLNPHPTLRWQCIPNATEYKVTVRGQGLSWAATAHSTSALKYPIDAPELKRGQPYKVVITAGGRSSEEDDQPGLGFTILSAEDEQLVRGAETEIDSLAVETPTKRLMSARLLANHGLIAEAMDTLEEPPQSCDVRLVPNPDTTDPDALQLLGLLYARIGLTRRAEGYLLAALQSSVQSGDSLGEAVSSDFLGQIYVALGNKKNALDKLQQAERAYKAIGDDENVAEVQRRSRILQMP